MNLPSQETDDAQESTEFMATPCALKINAIKKTKKYVCTTNEAINPHRTMLQYISTVCAGRNFPVNRQE